MVAMEKKIFIFKNEQRGICEITGSRAISWLKRYHKYDFLHKIQNFFSSLMVAMEEKIFIFKKSKGEFVKLQALVLFPGSIVTTNMIFHIKYKIFSRA
jgi:hypothetical protein